MIAVCKNINVFLGFVSVEKLHAFGELATKVLLHVFVIRNVELWMFTELRLQSIVLHINLLKVLHASVEHSWASCEHTKKHRLT